LRDPENKKKYAGNDEGWNFTEKILEEVAQDQGLKYKKEYGEAAFYGPKLDYKIKDCLGREWQCSTLQFDFNLPERFDMTFTNSQGEKERPYVLHRALFGSFERFIGLLIEQYAGALPFWLSPEQIWVLPISDKHNKYAKKVAEELRAQNLRVEIKEENDTVGKKIRNGEMQKIPYLLVVGDKEEKNKTVAVRERSQKDLGAMKLNKFITLCQNSLKKPNA
jgi:threonyl-tRNA synthetase